MVKEIKEAIQRTLLESEVILSARIYGSWLYNEVAVDCDVAIVIPSNQGVVDPKVYYELLRARNKLVEETGCDIDLVPHTLDEFDDTRSPFWFPRYNPSLVFGETIKSNLELTSVTKRTEIFSFADLTAYVLYDNRTICRKQLIRTLEGESGRIFASKLLHGPGNTLTYYACKNEIDYLCCPSELDLCFTAFDQVYGVESSPAINFFKGCKLGLDGEMAIKLINWYETLVVLVFQRLSPGHYSSLCLDLAS